MCMKMLRSGVLLVRRCELCVVSGSASSPRFDLGGMWLGARLDEVGKERMDANALCSSDMFEMVRRWCAVCDARTEFGVTTLCLCSSDEDLICACFTTVSRAEFTRSRKPRISFSNKGFLLRDLDRALEEP